MAAWKKDRADRKLRRRTGNDKGNYMEKKQKCSGREIAGFLLLGLSLIMLGKSVMLCFSSDIWYDELFTVGLAQHSYGELVRLTAADVHPPLYYCIVKLFADLCKLIKPGAGTIIPAKIVSVLPYFILLLYAVTLIRKRFGMFTGGLFLFCVTAMPQLSAYTVEMRMYGWALLFVTTAFLHGYVLVAEKGYGVRKANASSESYVNQRTGPQENAVCGKDGAGEVASADNAAGRRKKQVRAFHAAAFVLYGLAAAYTQYFACVAVVMVYLFLLFAFWFQDRRRLREWMVYVGISVIAYVPWLSALAGQLGAVRENYWILPLTWRSLGGCVKFLMKPAFANDGMNMVLAVLLFAAYLGLWCRWALKLYHNRREKSISVIKTQNKESKEGDKEYRNAGSEESCDSLADGEKEESPAAPQGGEDDAVRFWLATAGVGVLAGLVAFGFAASFLLRPIFVYRYMIPAAGCFWLGFALCLNNILCKPNTERQPDIKGKPGRYNIGRNLFPRVAGIALTILVVIVGLRDYRAFMGEEEYKIRLMKETEKALAMIGPQDSVVYNFDQVQAVTGYYLPETAERCLWQAEGEPLIQKITSPCGTVMNVEELRHMLEKTSEKTAGGGDGGSLWFIGSFNSREDIVAQWRDAGLKVEEKGSFLLERYWFNLYKIS